MYAHFFPAHLLASVWASTQTTFPVQIFLSLRWCSFGPPQSTGKSVKSSSSYQ
ncbi:hypothetical protein M758_N012900 [Ceratodon purpureus]|nr:hypothetical protein M758_N012900 [Ceratodon purpureus]